MDEARPRLSQREVSIEVRGEDGRIRTERRTFRQSGMGPLIDLGILSPALKTTDRQAFVLRDVNAGNDQVFAQYLAWNQAGSLTAFIGIQRRMLASPWVNTLAIGRGEGRVWYGDLGAVPAERDDWVQRCVVPGTDMQAIMQESACRCWTAAGRRVCRAAVRRILPPPGWQRRKCPACCARITWPT